MFMGFNSLSRALSSWRNKQELNRQKIENHQGLENGAIQEETSYSVKVTDHQNDKSSYTPKTFHNSISCLKLRYVVQMFIVYVSVLKLNKIK